MRYLTTDTCSIHSPDIVKFCHHYSAVDVLSHSLANLWSAAVIVNKLGDMLVRFVAKRFHISHAHSFLFSPVIRSPVELIIDI